MISWRIAKALIGVAEDADDIRAIAMTLSDPHGRRDVIAILERMADAALAAPSSSEKPRSKSRERKVQIEARSRPSDLAAYLEEVFKSDLKMSNSEIIGWLETRTGQRISARKSSVRNIIERVLADLDVEQRRELVAQLSSRAVAQMGDDVLRSIWDEYDKR